MSASSRPAQVVDFHTVHAQELRSIRRRRRKAGLHADREGCRGYRDYRVGMALSGGGIRSASFSLGMLQALDRAGALRHIDYLSAVSGGSYAAAFLASHVMADRWQRSRSATSPTAEPAVAAPPAAVSGNGAPSGPPVRRQFLPQEGEGGKQPDEIARLIHGGSYLQRPILFFNSYMIGLLALNVLLVSGVLFFAMLCAWLLRWMYFAPAMYGLRAYGARSDVDRALVPLCIALVLWLVAWALVLALKRKYVGRWARMATQVMFFVLLASVGLSVGVLLGTDDISLTNWEISHGATPAPETVRSISHTVLVTIIAALTAALLPYLRPRALLRSGLRPKNALEGWVFSAASSALLLGIPLFLVGFFAQENFSKYNETRLDRYAFSRAHFDPRLDFWRKVERERSAFLGNAVDEFAPSAAIWEAANLSDDGQFSVDQLLLRQSQFSFQASTGGSFQSAGDKAPTWSALHQLADRTRNRLNAPNARGSSAQESFVTTFGGVAGDVVRLEHFLREKETETPRWRLYVDYFTRAWRNDKDHNSYLALRELWPDCDAAWRYVERRINERCLGNLDFYKAFQALAAKAAADSPLALHYHEAKTLAAQHASLRNKFVQWQSHRNMNLKEEWERDESTLASAWKSLWWWAVPDSPSHAALSADHMMQEHAFRQLQRDVQRVNRRLLEAYYGKLIRSENTVFALVVTAEDQKFRGMWLGIFFGVFVFSLIVIRPNWVSVHNYYRDRLGEMWISPKVKDPVALPLAPLDTVASGAPYLLVNASLHMLPGKKDWEKEPTSRFLFSPKYCGSERTYFRRTSKWLRRYSVADAIAISGAAVSPMAASNLLLKAMLVIGNMRLGQWLPNPALPKRKIISTATPLAIGSQLLWWSVLRKRPEKQRYCFVTDGGHHENLGIEALLERRCRLIIAVDAGHDAEHRFVEILRLVRRSQMLRGIRFTTMDGGPMCCQDLVPNPKTHISSRHFLIARIQYPADPDVEPHEPFEGYIIYIRPSFTGDEDADLIGYRLENEDFPHDATLNQFFEPMRFESYRRLGYHIGQELLRNITVHVDLQADAPTLANWVPPRQELKYSAYGLVSIAGLPSCGLSPAAATNGHAGHAGHAGPPAPANAAAAEGDAAHAAHVPHAPHHEFEQQLPEYYVQQWLATATLAGPADSNGEDESPRSADPKRPR